jgi:hypothetical protein
MKKVLFTIALATIFAGCTPKKTETTSSIDSLKVDSLELATEPAPSSLAFDPLSGYGVKNTVELADSVNFLLLTSQEDLEKNFVVDKSAVNEVIKPDFVINYIIGVVCLPSQQKTIITLDKVEAAGDDINVYVNLQRGEKLSLASKPSQIFAIERRDAKNIQFFVNGKKDKSFFMTGM